MKALKWAIMAAAVFMHGDYIRAAERRPGVRPFRDLPLWMVGMLVLLFSQSRQPAARNTGLRAQAEWDSRHPPAPPAELHELWRVTISEWHDTDLPHLLRLPAGSSIRTEGYQGHGDRIHFLVTLKPGASITVVDTDRVRIERLL
jgi:hypothetical protein